MVTVADRHSGTWDGKAVDPRHKGPFPGRIAEYVKQPDRARAIRVQQQFFRMLRIDDDMPDIGMQADRQTGLIHGGNRFILSGSGYNRITQSGRSFPP